MISSQHDEMPILTKWQVDKMAFDQLTSLPNDKQATFQIDKMTIPAKMAS